MDDSSKIKNFTIPAAAPRKIGAVVVPVKETIESSENLDTLERQLQESLKMIQARKLEVARIEALRRQNEYDTRPLTAFVAMLSGSRVVVEVEERPDIVTIVREYNGLYRAGKFSIAVGDWNEFERKLLALPNLNAKYADTVIADIDRHLNAPVWYIELEKRNLRLTPGPGYQASQIMVVPGTTFNAEKRIYTCPRSEAFRIYEALSNTEGVLYSDEAREFVIAQVKKRADIDAIGKAEDWEFDVALANGNTLRGYQRVGDAFVEAAGGRALLAYEMGLGKTPMSIAYAVKHNLRTVVICPASLKANWCRQIEKFTGLQANVMIGAEPTNHDLVTLITNPAQFTVINFDLIGRKTDNLKVTTDELGFKHEEAQERFLWVEALNMSKPDLIIVDESHYIKNTDSNRSKGVRMLKSRNLIHMTGTPVLNRPGEMWAILNHIAPDIFPSEETFIRQYTIDGKKATNVKELQESLKSVMIRRKQSDVRKDLPPRNRVVEYHDLGKKAKKLYDKVLQGVYEKVEAYSSSGKHGGEDGIANILVQIQRLKQVCAIDKVERTAELAIELHESAVEERHNKVLIFSQFKACAYAIHQRLGHESLCFVSRGRADFNTASTDTRDKLVQQFQNDPKIKYLVVTEKTAREGHDCTEAGFVIFNDLFWTPANHEQGEGRAYMREVDPHDISSYYLITDKSSGDIEEWIWELLKMKTNVIDQTVEGVEGARGDTSVVMELISRMKDSMWSRRR